MCPPSHREWVKIMGGGWRVGEGDGSLLVLSRVVLVGLWGRNNKKSSSSNNQDCWFEHIASGTDWGPRRPWILRKNIHKQIEAETFGLPSREAGQWKWGWGGWEGHMGDRVILGGVMGADKTGGSRSLGRAESLVPEGGRGVVGSPVGRLHCSVDGGWLPWRLRFEFLSCTCTWTRKCRSW